MQVLNCGIFNNFLKVMWSYVTLNRGKPQYSIKCSDQLNIKPLAHTKTRIHNFFSTSKDTLLPLFYLGCQFIIKWKPDMIFCPNSHIFPRFVSRTNLGEQWLSRKASALLLEGPRIQILASPVNERTGSLVIWKTSPRHSGELLQVWVDNTELDGPKVCFRIRSSMYELYL